MSCIPDNRVAKGSSLALTLIDFKLREKESTADLAPLLSELISGQEIKKADKSPAEAGGKEKG